jgi:hypothetical protein
MFYLGPVGAVIYMMRRLCPACRTHCACHLCWTHKCLCCVKTWEEKAARDAVGLE